MRSLCLMKCVWEEEELELEATTTSATSTPPTSLLVPTSMSSHVDASDVLASANFHVVSDYSSGKDETNAAKLAVRKLMEAEVVNSKLKEEPAATDEEDLNVEKWETDTEDSIGTSGVTQQPYWI